MIKSPTISTKGQVTIPETIRTLAKVKPGTKTYQWTYNPDTDTFEFKVARRGIVSQLSGSLISTQPYLPYQQVRDLIGNSIGESYALKPKNKNY